MAPSSRDLTTVDLRGLKPQLGQRAAASGQTLSSVIRELLSVAIQCPPAPLRTDVQGHLPERGQRVRVCLRLSADQATALLAASRATGLPLGDFVAGLQAGVQAVQGGGRPEHLRQLAASTAALATLSRSLRHLNELVRDGALTAAQEYTGVIAALDDDVRRHLRLASRTMMDLLPRSKVSGRLVPRHPLGR